MNQLSDFPGSGLPLEEVNTGASTSRISISRKDLGYLTIVKFPVSIDPLTYVELKLNLEICDVKGKSDSAGRKVETDPIAVNIQGTAFLNEGSSFDRSKLSEASLVVDAIKKSLDLIANEISDYSCSRKRANQFYLTVHVGENRTHLLSTARLKSDCRRFDLGKGVEELTSALDDALNKLSERKPETVVIDAPTNSEDPAAAHSPETLEDLSVDRFESLLALEHCEVRIHDVSSFRYLEVSKKGVIFNVFSGDTVSVLPKIIFNPETKKKLGKGAPYVSGMRFDEKERCFIFSISFAKSVAEAQKSSISAKKVADFLKRASKPTLDPDPKKDKSHPKPNSPKPQGSKSFPDVKPRKVVPRPKCFEGTKGEEDLRKYLKLLWDMEGKHKILIYRDDSTGNLLVSKGSGEPTYPVFFQNGDVLQKFDAENSGALEYLRLYSWGALLTQYLLAVEEKGALLEEDDFRSLRGMEGKSAFETYAFYFSGKHPSSGQFMAPILKEHLRTLMAIYLNSLPTKPTTREEQLQALHHGIKTGMLPPQKIYDILAKYE